MRSETIPCARGCSRQIPAGSGFPIYCPVCLGEMDAGKVVRRQGILVDLPDEIRRYDQYGDVRVAVYLYKNRPNHTDPSDAPEVTWKQFVEFLLHNKDFPGSWHLWVFRSPNARGEGAQICMDAHYTASADHAYVRIKGGIL